MNREQDQAENWEEGYPKAQDFLSSFKLKTALVPRDRRSFYSSLTNLIASMMKRDREFVVGLADDEKTQTENGSYINYKTDPQAREGETRFFTTTRDGWAKLDFGPHMSGRQTSTGLRYIELAVTSAHESRFDNSLYPNSNYTSVRVHENGLVVGISASTGSSELHADELTPLIEIFRFGKIAVEESG